MLLNAIVCPPLTLTDLIAAGVVFNYLITNGCGCFLSPCHLRPNFDFDLTNILFREGLDEIDTVDPPVVAYLLMNDGMVEVIE